MISSVKRTDGQARKCRKATGTYYCRKPQIQTAYEQSQNFWKPMHCINQLSPFVELDWHPYEKQDMSVYSHNDGVTVGIAKKHRNQGICRPLLLQGVRPESKRYNARQRPNSLRH